MTGLFGEIFLLWVPNYSSDVDVQAIHPHAHGFAGVHTVHIVAER
jgi:hypothetical protein